jgi:hypothetical protein
MNYYLSVKYDANAFKNILVLLQRSGFQPKTFSQFISTDLSIGGSIKALLLRHDVDADMEAALSLALIEHELGIQSTYFFMIQSPIYNLFSRRNLHIANEILSMSHEIGLHSDVCNRHLTHDGIFEDVKNEMVNFSRMIGTEIKSVSFHQPTANALNHTTDYSDDGFISAYNDKRVKQLQYISDSNRRKTVSEISQECLRSSNDNQGRGVQLLIHPMWWIYDEATTKLVWDRVIEENLIATQEQLLATERAYGQLRRFKVISDE